MAVKSICKWLFHRPIPLGKGLFYRVLTFAVGVMSAHAMLDDNGNGMSDVWEYRYDAVDVIASDDPDNDGENNYSESLAGTDPFAAESFFVPVREDFIEPRKLLKWQSQAGISYRVQYSNSLSVMGWSDSASTIIGNGGLLTVWVNQSAETKGFWRVRAENAFGALVGGYLNTLETDSDGDGQGDVSEFLTGFDPSSRVSSWPPIELEVGTGTQLSWASQKGKHYQVQSQSGVGPWGDVGKAYVGTGDTVEAIVIDGDASNYRVQVEDVDSDGDGLNDWEEYQVGFDPLSAKTNPLGDQDGVVTPKKMASGNWISVSSVKPVANLTQGGSGAIEVSRSGGLDAVTVHYNISGSAVPGIDYVSLTGSVTIPFGVNSVTIGVKPLAGSSLTTARTVYAWIQAGEYGVEGSGIARVDLIRESELNVHDFGAVGDGVNDDTAAIQSAIDALEASPSFNTLYFPAGTYRLDSFVVNNETNSGSRCILKLGNVDLGGRNIIFKGELGSKLYSTVSPVKAHILIARASYRSLTFEGMTFEKNEVPLSEGSATGSDGVSVVLHDSRVVEQVAFDRCVFNNCHGSVFVYGNGHDIHGRLRKLSFNDCQIINPYGTNTTNIQNHWGGGQQVAMGAWVGTAVYTNNLFEGGGEDMTNHSLAPVGRLKDGGHFGSPRRLMFTNNVVRYMAVEALLQTNSQSYMGTTVSPFTMPPVDGFTRVTIELRPELTTYEVGQIVSVRRPATASFGGANNILRVIGFDSVNSLLSLVNDGHEMNDASGTIVARDLPLYLQKDDPSVVSIAHNLFLGHSPTGSEATHSTAIVVEARGVVSKNIILGYGTGVNTYGEVKTPLYPASRGLIIDSNFIFTRDSSTGEGYRTFGVLSYVDDQVISRNVITTPISKQFRGISTNAKNTEVKGNQISAVEHIVNGYGVSYRAVGIHVGNRSYGTSIVGNTTKWMDVGVGPSPNQWIIHTVEDHTSIEDTLGVDTHGLVAP